MHMLRRWLGDDDFRAGLKIYFEKHQYSNTIGRDLRDALSEASGKDVAAFMDAWLEQPGYPVVTAEVVDDTLVLSQNNSSSVKALMKTVFGQFHLIVIGKDFQIL